jgi:hypothetical protein
MDPPPQKVEKPHTKGGVSHKSSHKSSPTRVQPDRKGKSKSKNKKMDLAQRSDTEDS